MPGWFLSSVVSVLLAPIPLHVVALVSPADSMSRNMLSFVARLITSWASLVFCACYGVVASAGLRVVGYGGLSQWTVARSFKWTMWLTTGVTFEVVEGEEYLSERPAVFIGNHQTELDVLMLGCVFPPYCSVTAKKSLKYVPFLGWFMSLSKSVFIDRANRQSARAAFDGAAMFMQEHKQSVYIFPEGTRSYSEKPELLPFKKGAFHLAVQAQVPIVPIVVGNYSNILNIKKRIFRSGVIPVTILPPVHTKGLTAEAVDGLTQSTRDAMLKELISLSENRGHPMAMEATSARASGIDVDGHKPISKEL